MHPNRKQGNEEAGGQHTVDPVFCCSGCICHTHTQRTKTEYQPNGQMTKKVHYQRRNNNAPGNADTLAGITPIYKIEILFSVLHSFLSCKSNTGAKISLPE